MPYRRNRDLPDAVRKLSADGQTMWRKVFNSAETRYSTDEGKAFATAWSAVRKAGYSNPGSRGTTMAHSKKSSRKRKSSPWKMFTVNGRRYRVRAKARSAAFVKKQLREGMTPGSEQLDMEFESARGWRDLPNVNRRAMLAEMYAKRMRAKSRPGKKPPTAAQRRAAWSGSSRPMGAVLKELGYTYRTAGPRRSLAVVEWRGREVFRGTPMSLHKWMLGEKTVGIRRPAASKKPAAAKKKTAKKKTAKKKTAKKGSAKAAKQLAAEKARMAKLRSKLNGR